MNGAVAGHYFENYVVGEMLRTFSYGKNPAIFSFYRDKDMREIDLIVEQDGTLHPLEIKKSSNPGSELVSAFKILDKGSLPRGTGAILCLREELTAIDRKAYIVPIWMI